MNSLRLYSQTQTPYNAVTYCTVQYILAHGCQSWWVNTAAPHCLTQLLETGAVSAAVPVVRNPPCFPPIPLSNEDQRRGYQAPQSATSPIHICFDESPLMCWALQAQGIAPSSLISIPQRTQSTKPHGLSLTGDALTLTGNTSVFDHVIFWEAGSWTVCAITITCCNLSWSLLNTQLLQWS